MSSLLQDVRYALRSLTRDRGLTLAALFSVAIGIGANTAVFSVANAVVLRRLPYANAERLVHLWNRSPGLHILQDWFSTAQYFDIKSGSRSFEQVAIANPRPCNSTGNGEPERVTGVRVSSNLLPMFGVQPALGRLFVPEEDVPGRAATAVLTYGMWARRYGADPHVIGKTITLSGAGLQSVEIVGVLPRSFTLPRDVLPNFVGAYDPDLFLPLPLSAAALRDRGHEDYNVVAKLRSGVTAMMAQAEMDTLTARLRHDFPVVYPANGGLTFGVVPLAEQVSGELRRPLGILLGSVGLVLLIACSNVANLMLSRASGRTHEILVRVALGAPARRIVAQLLTESLLLATGGGVMGTVLAWLAIPGLRAIGSTTVPRLSTVDMDWRVLGFTFALSLISGVLFGLAPALRLTGRNLHASLRYAGHRTSAAGALWGRGQHLRRALIVGQAALSVTLLLGAGLLIRSFVKLQAVPPGFDPHGVLTMGLTMAGRKYANSPTVLQTYRTLWEQLEHLPGAVAAGGVSALPLSSSMNWGPITVEGRVMAPGESFINADQRIAAGHYFQAMQIPLLRGRLFDDRDTADVPRVIVIDERMARELWPNQDPVGKRIRYGGPYEQAPWQTVIGVVGQVKQYGLDADSRISYYMAHTQQPSRALSLVVRTQSAADGAAGAARRIIGAMDPELPVYDVRTMDTMVAESLARRRFTLWLLGLFAALATALSAAGTYGVRAHLVNQSTREIGIRMALGATDRNIAAMVLRSGVGIAAAGSVVGLLGAVGLGGLIRSFLFNVEPWDPLTFAIVPCLLGVVVVSATYFPARRASRTEPTVALRSE